jgi:hypothetical protein
MGDRHNYLHRKKGLAVTAITSTFTVTYAGHEITVRYDHANIQFETKSGTPSDAFEINQPPGQSAVFSSVATGKSFPNARLLADHL